MMLSEVVKSGYLIKSPSEKPRKWQLQRWHRRYFLLADSRLVYPLVNRYLRLEYYQSEEDARKLAFHKGVINLDACTQITSSAGPIKGHKHVFDVHTNKSVYHLAAGSDRERSDWIMTLNDTLFREQKESSSEVLPEFVLPDLAVEAKPHHYEESSSEVLPEFVLPDLAVEAKPHHYKAVYMDYTAVQSPSLRTLQEKPKPGISQLLKRVYSSTDTSTNGNYIMQLTREQADYLLTNVADHGGFLIRPSSKPNCYVLSFRWNDVTEHVLITNIGGHYSLGGVQKEFATVSGLVTYCRSSKFVDIQLDHLLYADWQSCCQRNLQPKEAEHLLQKQGRVGTYIICPLADSPHSYTLSVRAGDTVHHVTIRKENEVFHDSEGSQFKSLSELVLYYRENPIMLVTDIRRSTDKEILLKEPLYSTSFLPLYIAHQVRILKKESHNQSGFQKEFQKLPKQRGSKSEKLSSYTIEALGVQYICNPQWIWEVVEKNTSNTVVTLRSRVEVVQELPGSKTSVTFTSGVDLNYTAVEPMYKDFQEYAIHANPAFLTCNPKHFVYMEWPEEGVPLDPGSVAEFLHDVHGHWWTSYFSNSPIVVRSTTGRIGIFLVLHCLVHAITSKAGRYSDMNVYEAAQLVMDKSGGFTLTEEQYRFIYATMQSYVEAHKVIFATNSRTFATGEYVDDPDYFHSSEPELSSEDSGSEGASTEKDVEKNGLAEERQLKDDDSKQLFEEAMEKGYVDTRLVIFLLIGAAGSGKTHVKHLALQLPPPLFRQSTPLAEMPIRAISLWRATVKGSSTKWFPVGPDEFTKMIVEAIKAGVPRGIIPFPWLLSLPPVPPMIGQSETPSPSLNELADQAPQQAVDIPPTSSEAVTLPPNTSHELADVDSSSDEDHPPSPALSENDSTAKLEEELVDLISKASGSRRLLEVDWVHLIDSGGQPQFHEILPAFVRNASAAVFVSKLNELLRQRPTVEYYGKDGQKCGSSYSSLLTHEQILRHSFRAMQSRLCTSSTRRSPKVFVVGTHKDREGECEETRAQKNERLLNMLRPVFQDNLAIYRKSDPDELMYPVDAKHPGEEDRKVADALRQAVMKMCNEERVKIPLPWFVFEQFVRQLAAERDVGLISLEECRKISRRLHMSEESFRAALKYLVGLNIFFYYPDLLPEVVFCESQVVLDKISELVELSHTLRGKSDTPALDIELCQGAEWERFRYHGILTIELLEEFPKHYSVGLFTCHDLLKLLKGLLIVAQVSNTEHIMPCVLPELSAEEVTTHRLLDPTSPCTPLLVQYQDKWVPSGVFTILISYLQNEAHWQVVLRYGSPVCLYRNCVKFKLPTGQRGAVAVIDSFEYLEVHVQTTHTTCSKLCFQIRQDVFQGLDKAADVLGYEGLKPQEAFFCLQRDTTCDTTFHPACLQEDEWICSVNPEVGGELTDQHRVWLESFPESHTSATTPTGQKHHRTLQEPSSAVIPHSSDVPMLHQLQCLQVRSTTVRVIDTVAAKWEDIAIALHFNTPDIETVKWDTRLLAVPACRTVFQKWLKGEGCKPVSWGRLIEALIAATFINLAEQLQEILKD